MNLPMSLFLLAGKLIFLVLLYLFLMWAFRGLFDRLSVSPARPVSPRARRRPTAMAPDSSDLRAASIPASPAAAAGDSLGVTAPPGTTTHRPAAAATGTAAAEGVADGAAAAYGPSMGSTGPTDARAPGGSGGGGGAAYFASEGGGAVAEPLAAPAADRAGYSTRAYLQVEAPGSTRFYSGQQLDLPAAVTLGRAEDNGLVIDDKFCSQHHAMIFSHEGQRFLRDRNSTNGTYHNGQRITADALLREGDRIALGTVVLIYRTKPPTL